MRRAQWSALGLTDEDLEKPKIAIVNSSSAPAGCGWLSVYARTVTPLARGATLGSGRD
jgi:dihydroxyacid dehydratase/phosphogluconate dehydratase